MNATHRDPDAPGNGLAIVQSNRPEDLCRLLIEHLRQHPPAPLESEIVLTQSNGIARWLELEMAADPERGGHGISASTEFLLPARFLWETYRMVLGDESLPDDSAFDSGHLRWRFHGLLPGLVGTPVFAPLADYLAQDRDDVRRRWQLAVELAGLYEQYQFYRADWLLGWEAGEDTVTDARGRVRELRDRECWQPALWRALLDTIPAAHRHQSRAHLHQRFIDALEGASGDEAFITALPRRVVVFGISSMPAQVIDGLAALARHIQILVFLHNPCRHYWADIIEGRDLLRSRPGKRLQLPPGWSDSDDGLHEAANPLLASWGRQGRDFYALLDEHDDPEHYRNWFETIDVFTPHVDEESEPTLLASIQQGVLDLKPPADDEAGRIPVAVDDDSIRLNVAHSRQREVEILHDQLLAVLAADEKLHPRDIMVMVPDIDAYAPHIDAVFGGQAGNDPNDARFIPYSIGDRRERLVSSCLRAVETLLHLPDSRLTANQAMDLLNVPAVRQCFDIAEGELERIGQWLEGSGIRWGLNGEHRGALGLRHAFEQNSWRFGTRRMLLGHASGEGEAFDDIQPYDEVSSGEADLAGRLAQFVHCLDHHWRALREDTDPAGWAERIGSLVRDFIAPASGADEMACHQIGQATEQLVEQAERAGFEEALPLSIVREVLLEQIDTSHVSHRFLGGKVNFSTLMPMRAIPFRMVCLLGMNDGDFPRTRKPADFDLMSQRGLFRPGDRSRREDDRYLFLEALLSARQRLCISWVGKSIRNDEDQPPSVLVGQLRDHIAAGWCLDGAGDGDDAGQKLLEAITTHHPLQPFSPRYFHGEPGLFTYAREWRQAHAGAAAPVDEPRLGPPPIDEAIDARQLGAFLSQPVRHFMQKRLLTNLELAGTALPESEPFAIGGLESWQLNEELLGALTRGPEPDEQALKGAARRLRLSGRLPLGRIGDAALDEAIETVRPVAGHWREAVANWPDEFDPYPARFGPAGTQEQSIEVAQWLSGLRTRADGHVASIVATTTNLKASKKVAFEPRWEKLVAHWPLHLLVNACGFPMHTLVAHREALFEWQPVAAETARSWLSELVEHWLEGMRRPLPVAAATSSRWLEVILARDDWDAADKLAVKTYCPEFGGWGELARELSLQRFYPDFESLRDHGERGDDFVYWACALYQRPIEHWHQAQGEVR